MNRLLYVMLSLVVSFSFLHAQGRALLKTQEQAAAATGYRLEPGNATEMYIDILKRAVENGSLKEAEKSANDLLKKATAAGQTATRLSALDVLLLATGEGGSKYIQAEMRDPSAEYRKGVLEVVSSFAAEPIYADLLKFTRKAPENVKVEILNWIAREATDPDKNELLKKTELRFDLTANEFIINQFDKGEYPLKQAAVHALTQIGLNQSIPVIVSLLGEPDEEMILLGRDALLSFKGNVAVPVARIIPKATDPGKIAAVEILAARKASQHIGTVFELIRSGSPEVRMVAYRSLKDLVSSKDFVAVCGMLESVDRDPVPYLQQAVLNAVSSYPVAEQIDLVRERMLQAGDMNKPLYYPVLASINDPGVIEVLEKELEAARTDEQRSYIRQILQERKS